MNEEEKFNDNILRELISRSPLDEPSPDFVKNVMGSIQDLPVLSEEKKPFYLFLRSAWPYAAIIITLLVVLMTSDFPLARYIPGMSLFHDSVGPIFGNLFASLAGIFKSLKPSSLVVTVIIGGSALLVLDRILFRKPKAHKTFLV
jgi:hypothetical protein